MLYKLTEKTLRNGRTLLVVESSDTAQPGFIDLPPHLLENARYKTITQVLQEQDEWVEKQRQLESERLAQLAIEKLNAEQTIVLTDTEQVVE